MSDYTYLLAALFLPLFPLSMIFNLVYARLRQPALRVILLLGWPHAGLLLVSATAQAIPAWLAWWGLLTALLYGLRALSLRDLGLWSGFVATSSWALLWIMLYAGNALQQVHAYALSFGIPLAMLILLGGGLERRFGAAFAGVHGGLAQTMPRFAGVLVLVILAIVATPLFPAFFAMLAAMINTVPIAPLLALGVATVWLLWSWAGARLLQEFIVGPAHEEPVADMNLVATWAYVLGLTALVIVGVSAATRGLL